MADETILLKDGRRLGYAEYGDPHGKPVFFFHGTPGSRKMRNPDSSIVENARIRFITVDRPGYGLSDPLPNRRFPDWPADVSGLADHLGIREFQIVAFSGGGPYALATALQLGNRVKSVALVSSVGPLDACASPHRNLFVRFIFGSARRMPWILKAATRRLLSRAKQDFDRSFEWAAARLPECDQQVLKRPEVRAVFRESIAESFRNGTSTFIHEVQLLTRSWELPLRELSQPVTLWHGEFDVFSNGHGLASLIPDCRARFLSTGHLVLFTHWQEIVNELQD